MWYAFTDVPKVSTPEELIGAELGRSAQITCRASAYPEALIYWKHGSKLHVFKEKYMFFLYMFIGIDCNNFYEAAKAIIITFYIYRKIILKVKM